MKANKGDLNLGEIRQERGPLILASSEALGWSSASASARHEVPCAVGIASGARHLLISSHSGPGDVTYRMDGRVVTRHVQARGLFFLPAGQYCHVTLHNPLDSIHLQLDPELFCDPERDAADPGAGLAPILGDDDQVLQSLLGAIEKLIRFEPAGSSLVADSVTRAIAARLVAANHRDARLSTDAVHLRRLGEGHLRKVRDYVEANLSDEIRLRTLAELCGMSVAHFIRLFKSATGVSPYQYVLGLRIRRAKSLLDDRALTLDDVARSCGFTHQQHLASTFRRLTGVTPGVYRRNRAN